MPGSWGNVCLIKRLLQNKYMDFVWVVLLFVLHTGAYFVTAHVLTGHHPIHVALDDVIHYCKPFIVPYVLWYLYIPLLMLWAWWKDRAVLRRQALTLLVGMLLSYIVFFAYPTVIDFRPEAVGSDVFSWICRIIYRYDTPPVNALPSLHCSETLILYLCTFTVDPFRKKKWIHAAALIMAVLICLSTMFVKQHSALDVATGLAVAVVAYTFVRLLLLKREAARTSQPEKT